MENIGGINNVIFDLDGVLIDSMPYHLKSYKEAFKPRGVEVDPEQIYEREGEDASLVISNILETENMDPGEGEVQEIVEEKRKIFKEVEETEVFPGMGELLSDLRKKYKLGLVSGSNRKSVVEFVEKYFGGGVFDCIISSDDVDEEKPRPKPYLNCLEKMGAEKQESLVIENAPLGIQAAKRAGIKCAAVASYLSEERLEEAGLVFENHGELKEWIRNNLL